MLTLIYNWLRLHQNEWNTVWRKPSQKLQYSLLLNAEYKINHQRIIWTTIKFTYGNAEPEIRRKTKGGGKLRNNQVIICPWNLDYCRGPLANKTSSKVIKCKKTNTTNLQNLRQGTTKTRLLLLAWCNRLPAYRHSEFQSMLLITVATLFRVSTRNGRMMCFASQVNIPQAWQTKHDVMNRAQLVLRQFPLIQIFWNHGPHMQNMGPWNLWIQQSHTESTVNAISCIVTSFNVISSSDKRGN